VLGDPQRQPVRCAVPLGFVQVGQAGAVGQPPAVGQGQGYPGSDPHDQVPARVQDRGDQVIAREITVRQEHSALEQLRPVADQPGDQRLLPGVDCVRGRAKDRPPGPCGDQQAPQPRERLLRPLLLPGADLNALN
jgi:hypothetical protein